MADPLRRTYTVQLARDGATMILASDGKRSRLAFTAPDRQYPILVDGQALG